MSEFIKRPSPSETEEDILRQFEESRRGGSFVPSAKVSKLYDKSSSSPGQPAGTKHPLPNELREDEEEEAKKKARSKLEEIELEEVEEPVISSIKEKFNVPQGHGQVSHMLKEAPKFKLDLKEFKKVEEGGQKKSLFAQAFDKKFSKSGQESNVNPPQMTKGSDEGEAVIGDQIHPGLTGMTEKEILEEQRKLIERLDPKIVEFLRAKGSAQPPPSIPTASSSSQQSQPEPKEPQKNLNLQGLPLDLNELTKYPGMSKIEPEKLEWMGTFNSEAPPQPPQSNQEESKLYSARFDFNGYILPPGPAGDGSTFQRGLHHHGEEMERPGYTMEELMSLARSANSQQRSIAYDTMANILTMAHKGLLAVMARENILSFIFTRMDFIWLIRKGIDEANTSINAALNCLSALLYSPYEEEHLDETYIWPGARPYPLIIPESSPLITNRSDLKELKDAEFLQLDLIDFFLRRTSLLERLDYLICKRKELLNEAGIDSILKILIRLARHSPNLVIKHEEMLQIIFAKHFANQWTLGMNDKDKMRVPFSNALKLFRILIDSSLANAKFIYRHFDILPALLSLLAFDQWAENFRYSTSGLLLLESFNIWIGLVSYGLATDEFLAFYPRIMHFLHLYIRGERLTPFDLNHAAHLFTLLNEILMMSQCPSSASPHVHWELVKEPVGLVGDFIGKLVKILKSPELLIKYETNETLLALTTAFHLITNAWKYEENPKVLCIFKEFRSSPIFNEILDQLEDGTSAILAKPPQYNYSENIESTSLSYRGVHRSTILSQECSASMHLVTTCIRFGILCKLPIDLSTLPIQTYLGLLLKTKHSPVLFHDYYLRFESYLILEMIQSMEEPKNRFKHSLNLLKYIQISNKGLGAELLSICTELGTPTDKGTLELYVKYLIEGEISSRKERKVQFKDFDEKDVKFQRWSTPLFPPHPLYEPLIQLRRDWINNHDSRDFERTRDDIVSILGFLTGCVHQFGSEFVRTREDFVILYSRLALIFMFDEHGFFMDPEIASHLSALLKFLQSCPIYSKNQSIFSGFFPVDKFTPAFEDFYTELANSYDQSSFGDGLFSAFMLLPLRVCEGPKLKITFWTVCSGVFLRQPFDEMLLPLKFLSGEPETDESTLGVYLQRAGERTNMNPYAKSLLKFHLEAENVPASIRDRLAGMHLQ